MTEHIDTDHFKAGLPSRWQRLKSWMRLLSPRWPEGAPLISGGVRWGTRLADGTIEGAPGVDLTPLPICSGTEAAI